jgi:AbrB family looped-hinge helix DNA binding protein
MVVKVYKDGKILIPLELRKKFNIEDNSELIVTECEDGIKISTKQILLNKLRNEFANVDLNTELQNFRKSEFTKE